MEKRHARLMWFATHILNPLVVRFAGKGRTPFALVRHVGRRSGKPYATPIIVRRTPHGFVFALTYGPSVDWLRNLQNAKGGTLLWHGREYAIGDPVHMDLEEGLRAFAPPERFILRATRTSDFVLAPPAVDVKRPVQPP